MLFDNFYNYAGFGPAIQRREVPVSSIVKYQRKLPGKLLAYWREYGWCGYGKGLFWTVNPEEWEDELDAWIGETEFMERDAYHVIARGAFGDLFLWGEKTGPSLHIRPHWGFIYPTFQPDKIRERGLDRTVQLFFSAKRKDVMDQDANDGKPLFDRALECLGPLDHETMYGFEPALAFSGTARLKDLKKVDAHVHLDMLAQVTPKQVMLDIVSIARSRGLL